MDWYWILYWVGYPVSFLSWTYAMAEQAADAKRELEWRREREMYSSEFDYYSSLWALALAPIFASFLWPAVLAFALVVAFIASIGWLLDSAVSAFMKDSPNE